MFFNRREFKIAEASYKHFIFEVIKFRVPEVRLNFIILL